MKLTNTASKFQLWITVIGWKTTFCFKWSSVSEGLTPVTLVLPSLSHLLGHCMLWWSQHCIVIIVTGLWDGQCEVWILAGARDFSLPQSCRPTMGPMQLPCECVLEFFPGDKAARAWCWPFMSSLMLRLRISGACLFSLCMPSWHGQGQLYLLYTSVCCGVRGRWAVSAVAWNTWRSMYKLWWCTKPNKLAVSRP